MMDIRLIGIENFDLITPTNIIGERFLNAAYVRSNFKVSQIEMSSPNVIGIKIDAKKGRPKLQIFGYYRTHMKILDSHQKDLAEALNEMMVGSDSDMTLVGGDFNLDFAKLHKQDYSHRGLSLTLQSWMADQGMVQKIKDPTWRRVIERHKWGLQAKILCNVNILDRFSALLYNSSDMG
jgi:hypothetical protein